MISSVEFFSLTYRMNKFIDTVIVGSMLKTLLAHVNPSNVASLTLDKNKT